MKKIISYLIALLIVTSVAAAPDSKLEEQFKAAFPNAQNVKWSDDKAGHFVSFYQDGNFEKILYNKNGEFVSSWKYSDGKALPVNVVMSINKNYCDGRIIGVTEFSTTDNIIYEIKISKGDKWYSVTALANGNVIKEEKHNN